MTSYQNSGRGNIRGDMSIVPSLGGMDNAAAVTVAQNGRGSGLTPTGVVEVPNDIHMTPADIRGMQASDADIAKFPRLGSAPGADKKVDERLLAAERGFSSRMGLAQPAQIIVAGTGPEEVPGIASGFTKEGTPYIQLNNVALRTWTPEQLEGMLALETSRLRNGDAKPERMAAAANDQRLAFQDTFRADREAAGPMGTNNPRALAQALAIGEQYRVDSLRSAGATDLRDPEHPPMDQRILLLDKQAQAQQKAGPKFGSP
jgi:hypothetical protein